MKPIGWKRVVVAGLLALGLPASYAQQSQLPSHERVLRSSQVNEEQLIKDLEIEGPEAPAGDVRTRGFRPAAPGAVRKPAGPGKASLLITFETGSVVLLPESKAALDKMAAALQSDRLAAFSFRVEGHADPRGASEQNLTLSQQRAQAVVDYLVKERGVLPERLTPLGKGDAEPLDAKRPEAPENRRVTFVTERK